MSRASGVPVPECSSHQNGLASTPKRYRKPLAIPTVVATRLESRRAQPAEDRCPAFRVESKDCPISCANRRGNPGAIRRLGSFHRLGLPVRRNLLAAAGVAKDLSRYRLGVF